MGRQTDTLRLLKPKLKGARVGKDVLVVLPTWRVITPLNRLYFDDSERTSARQPIRLGATGLEETAETIAELLVREHLTSLREMRGPGDFLKHVAWMAGKTTKISPFLADLNERPDQASARARSWERESIERLGLAETVIEPDHTPHRPTSRHSGRVSCGRHWPASLQYAFTTRPTLNEGRGHA